MARQNSLHAVVALVAALKGQIADLLGGGDAYFGDGLVAAALKEDSPWLTLDATTGNYGQAVEGRVAYLTAHPADSWQEPTDQIVEACRNVTTCDCRTPVVVMGDRAPRLSGPRR